MNRIIFATLIGLATASAAAQSNPENTTTEPPSQTPTHECEPYPDCLVIDSPLNPGAPGIGIRDKELVDQLQGPLRQPKKEGVIEKPVQR